MVWFKAKCPHCGSILEPTGHSTPYPAHQCRACISRSKKERDMKALLDRVAALEKTHSQMVEKQ